MQRDDHGFARETLSIESFAEASLDCIWILRPDGEVEYLNPRARSLHTAARARGAHVNLRELWPAESQFTLERALTSAADGRPHRFRTFISGPDKTRTYWETVVSPVRDGNAAITNLIAIARDVTVKVETTAFLQSVIQILPSALLVRDAASGHLLLLNPAAERLLNTTSDDALGRTIEAVAPQAAAALREAEGQVLENGGIRVFDYCPSTSPQEPVRYFRVTVLATHDDLGPRHLIAMADDVTEQRETDEQLRAALKAAQQASEAKSTFLANISHELRTPLNGIVAGADILARGDLPERSKTLAEMIHRSGECLTQLVTDILDLSKIENGHVRLEDDAFDLGEAVHSTAALFALEAERKKVALDVQIAPDLAGENSWVMGDPNRMRQVLGNLLGNAIKFTERGGIVVRVARMTRNAIRFDVIDTGIGFDPRRKAQLFGRFQQADNSITRRFGGAGLGLAISRQLVELMGGTMDCESAEGIGSTFWFTLALPAAARSDDVAPTAAAPVGLRVLLADDHPINRQVVQIMLSATADVTAVEDGAEAVAAFSGSKPFDLVLMDMQMPTMDGLAAVGAIRRLEAAAGAPRTPIIMLTANSTPEHFAASVQAGADFHLCKPVTVQGLIGAISEVLSKAESAHDHAA